MKNMQQRMIVLAIGNILHRDEGVGAHALRVLEAHLNLGFSYEDDEQILPTDPDGIVARREVDTNDGLEFIDGGTIGLNLLPVVEEASHLLILDAVDGHKAPGTVIEMSRDKIPTFSGMRLSQHQGTFQEVLALVAMRDKLPRYMHLIGVQPADLGIGLELSPVVAAALPEVIGRAVAVLEKWGDPSGVNGRPDARIAHH